LSRLGAIHREKESPDAHQGVRGIPTKVEGGRSDASSQQFECAVGSRTLG